jgi:pimeloyl-ACP methyl ester carboxylesterase
MILEKESLILVGHSMAGVIISQLAENFPEKIEQLVYLTAFILDHNRSLFDEEQKAIKPSVGLEVTIDEEKSSIIVKNSPKFKELFYNHCLDELYEEILL